MQLGGLIGGIPDSVLPWMDGKTKAAQPLFKGRRRPFAFRAPCRYPSSLAPNHTDFRDSSCFKIVYYCLFASLAVVG